VELELKFERDRDLYNALREFGFEAEYASFTTVKIKSYGAYELLKKITDKPIREIVIKESMQISRVITEFDKIKSVLYAIEMANVKIDRLSSKLETRNIEVEGLRNRIHELENIIEQMRDIVSVDC